MADYHDYVIKNGKLIGKFEDMYKDCDDPWHQSEPQNNELSYARNIAILNMKKFGIKSVVEFGCGFGYYTNMIKKAGIDVIGVDISQEAITKANRLFPDLDFQVGKIQELEKYSKYDAFLLAEIIWYILPDLDSIIETMVKFRGKYLISNLVFYKKNQQYGIDYFTTLDEFIDRIPFECVARSESTTRDSDTIETSSIFKI